MVLLKVMLGETRLMFSMFSTRSSASWSPVTAVTARGTSWTLSSRRWAVTVTVDRRRSLSSAAGAETSVSAGTVASCARAISAAAHYTMAVPAISRTFLLNDMYPPRICSCIASWAICLLLDIYLFFMSRATQRHASGRAATPLPLGMKRDLAAVRAVGARGRPNLEPPAPAPIPAATEER